MLCITAAAHVFCACNVAMCFWNLIPCKFVILELTTVSKFSCILGVYFQTFEYWTHSYIIIGLYFGFRKPNSCIWYGSEFIWTHLNFNVFWTWHSHLDLDLFEMWNECFLWVYSGYTMGMFLVYSGYSMGILWVYYGYTLEKKVSGEVEEGTWNVSISYPLSLQDLFLLVFMDLTLWPNMEWRLFLMP